MKHTVRGLVLAFVVGFLLFGPSAPGLCSGPSGELVIFHAGSLTIPLAEIQKEFEAKYPQVHIKRTAGGSSKLARLIAESGKPADVMASADYAVIDKTLIPGKASWNVRFAANQMVLCYTDKSQHAKDITAENWYDILGREGVKWGHSDPDLDPAGYRSLMVIQLAEIYYKSQGLYKKLIDNRPQTQVLPDAAQLVRNLKEGALDYAWEYISVAVQHQLKYIKLPDNINLGDYAYDDFYRQATVEVSGSKPGTKIKKHGKSITYGVTAIKDGPNNEAAIAFLHYMLSPLGGLRILKEQGQPPFIPCRVPSKEMKEKLPPGLGDLVEVRQ